MEAIINLDKLENIYELNLSPLPNYVIETIINQNIFTIEIKTFWNEETRITITKGSMLLCNNANFKQLLNLNYFSDYKQGAFFFLASFEKENYNYKNLNEELRLYYGDF